MELFLEFVITILISLLFSFFLAKILSASSSSYYCSTYGDVVVSGERKFEAKSKKNGSECERTNGSVEKDMAVGDTGESRQDKNDSCGSRDDLRIHDNQLLTEVEQKLVEESADKSDAVSECEENLVVEGAESGQKVESEIDSTKDGLLESEKTAKFVKDLAKDEVLESENKNEEDDGEGKGSIVECEQILVDENDESEKITKSEIDYSEQEVGVAKSEEIEILKVNIDNEIKDANLNGEEVFKEVLLDEDDDWEGIERTELERVFGIAVAFVGNKSNADRISILDGNVKTQLYGFHKIATEGPCHEPQPMALKVSARANWKAWKQLGDMAPEVAMEQYVSILLKNIPGCIKDDISGDLKTWKRD